MFLFLFLKKKMGGAKCAAHARLPQGGVQIVPLLTIAPAVVPAAAARAMALAPLSCPPQERTIPAGDTTTAPMGQW